LFEWADSYDAKDWERLSKCIAPTLKVRNPNLQPLSLPLLSSPLLSDNRKHLTHLPP
jgi:hypothetical protein